MAIDNLEEAENIISELEEELLDRLGGGEKNRVIERVKKEKERIEKNTGREPEAEGVFTKHVLREVLEDVFEEVHVQGVKDSTKNIKIFGKTAGKDFTVEKPIRAAGEVKYSQRFAPSKVAKCIGQALLYGEAEQYPFGIGVYYVANPQQVPLSDERKKLIEKIWKEHKIALLLI